MDNTGSGFEIRRKNTDNVKHRVEKKSAEKGSLTIEAIISFTVFLAVSFLMLQLVKLTMISLVMNSCTQETAKQLATSCYPIVEVNEVISDVNVKISDISTSVTDALKEQSGSDALGSIMGAETDTVSGVSELFQKLVGIANDGVMSIFRGLKGKAGIYITAKIMDGYLDSSGFAFDKDKVVFRVVQLPLTEGEYKNFIGYTVKGEKNDLVLKPSSDSEGFDGDFNRDDVVVCAEYDYKVVLPMIPAISLKLRSTAVEHAWLGGCSSTTSKEAGLKDKIFSDSVYVSTGGYGKSYHREDCITLKSSKSNGYTAAGINLSVAKANGLKPCKVCNP